MDRIHNFVALGAKNREDMRKLYNYSLGVENDTHQQNMKTVYLVRHGDYDYRDSSPPTKGQHLSPTGTQQAKITGDWFSSLPNRVSSIHSSDYLRAKETAEIIASNLPGLSVKTWHDLRECTDVYYKDLIKPLRKPESAWQRHFQSSEICDQYEVIVCHANLIRYFLSRIQAWSKQDWEKNIIGNCSISEIQVDERSNKNVRSVGNEDHLPNQLRELVENIA